MNGLMQVLKMIVMLFVKNADTSQTVSEKKETVLTPKPEPTPQILFKNGSKRLEDEYNELFERNRYLQEVLLECQLYCQHNFNKNIVVTMIYRTDAEQDEIYKNDAKYKEKKFKSPHQFYHAFDLRSSTFETQEIEKLVNYLNSTYDKNNYYKWTAKNHDVGLGEHFHVQFAKK